MQQQSATHNDNFIPYLRLQKRWILTAIGISLLSFVLLKILFPYPDIVVDSTSYIFWAFHDFEVAYRPIGYSYILKFLHGIAAPHLFTVFIQYLLFLFSSLFCFLSIDFFYKFPDKLKRVMILVILLDPMLLLQTNQVSSDMVFCSLTVTWLTLCIWILKRPGWLILVLHAVTIYSCFEVRLAAMFYPAISVVTFLLCARKWHFKIIGIVLTGALVFFYVDRQMRLNDESAEVRVVSGFSGWQIANNALYCYKHITIDKADLPSPTLQAINTVIGKCIDSLPAAPGAVGVQYMWDNRSPLKLLCMQAMKYYKCGYGSAWIRVSKDYSDYGWYIVKTFPGAYFQYYILPNTKKFFLPDLEVLGEYNSSKMTTLPMETREWFGSEFDHIECRLPALQRVMMSVFPVISLLLNVLNISLLIFGTYRIVKAGKVIAKDIKLLFFVWAIFYLLFAAFNIFATAVNLRFMDPLFVLGIIIPIVLWFNFRKAITGVQQ